MDPNVIHEQPGAGSGAAHRPGDDGADHLRRMKAQLVADAQSSSPVATNAGTQPVGRERRRSPRFQCSGSVELQDPGSDVRIWGTLTDISLHGCYVEMPTTFPLDTEVALNVDSLGIRFSTKAKVRATYPFLGMGMCFSDMDLPHRKQLTELLKLLMGQHRVNPAPSATPLVEHHRSAKADSESLLEKLTEYFESNGLLSRDEFYAIAKRARHS